MSIEIPDDPKAELRKQAEQYATLIQKGIPTIGIGPLCGDLSQNDGVDEWVDTEDHVRFVGAVAGIIAQWCGVAKLQA